MIYQENNKYLNQTLECSECGHSVELSTSYIDNLEAVYKESIDSIKHRFICSSCDSRNYRIYKKINSQPEFDNWSVVRAGTLEGITLEGSTLCNLCKNYKFDNICSVNNSYIQVHPAYCDNFHDARQDKNYPKMSNSSNLGHEGTLFFKKIKRK